MRRGQLDAAHRTLQQYQQAARHLQAGCPAQTLGEVQMRLASCDLQGAAQYWHQLAAAAVQARLDLGTRLQQPLLEPLAAGSA